jgi:hypothetical protein
MMYVRLILEFRMTAFLGADLSPIVHRPMLSRLGVLYD